MISDLASNLVGLAPNWTNLGLFNISFSTSWLSELILKSPRFVPVVWVQYDPIGVQLCHPCIEETEREYIESVSTAARRLVSYISMFNSSKIGLIITLTFHLVLNICIPMLFYKVQ